MKLKEDFRMELDSIENEDDLHEFIRDWIWDNDFPSMSLDELIVEDAVIMTPLERAEADAMMKAFYAF